MVGFFIFWGVVILIGILVIMSGYNDVSDKEKEQKKRNVKTFVIVIIVLLVLGSLGFFDSCDTSSYDDPSNWARRP